ncbi:unnamed protein product [Arabis nemorensis]|uniref:Uncharacterized protein n=1 Tax=Arabis nemorensis TaxID=586526 RepID=A0A565B032_9BRAS|nr:unnamed protein product [Arabis nemorensis]
MECIRSDKFREYVMTRGTIIKVQRRFGVDIEELPEQIDTSTYSFVSVEETSSVYNLIRVLIVGISAAVEKTLLRKFKSTPKSLDNNASTCFKETKRSYKSSSSASK